MKINFSNFTQKIAIISICVFAIADRYAKASTDKVEKAAYNEICKKAEESKKSLFFKRILKKNSERANNSLLKQKALRKKKIKVETTLVNAAVETESTDLESASLNKQNPVCEDRECTKNLGKKQEKKSTSFLKTDEKAPEDSNSNSAFSIDSKNVPNSISVCSSSNDLQQNMQAPDMCGIGSDIKAEEETEEKEEEADIVSESIQNLYINTKKFTMNINSLLETKKSIASASDVCSKLEEEIEKINMEMERTMEDHIKKYKDIVQIHDKIKSFYSGHISKIPPGIDAEYDEINSKINILRLELDVLLRKNEDIKNVVAAQILMVDDAECTKNSSRRCFKKFTALLNQFNKTYDILLKSDLAFFKIMEDKEKALFLARTREEEYAKSAGEECGDLTALIEMHVLNKEYIEKTIIMKNNINSLHAARDCKLLKLMDTYKKYCTLVDGFKRKKNILYFAIERFCKAIEVLDEYDNEAEDQKQNRWKRLSA
ncbi:hypothetical protein NEAUS03_0709 [Nematocida ausubeli]|nr:hypothetical protein NEAUS03_0709 [Nematocida ausubeli]